MAAGNASLQRSGEQQPGRKIKEPSANQLLTVANRSDGAGGFLFGGRARPRSSVDAAGGVAYRLRQRRAPHRGRGTDLPLTVNGDVVFHDRAPATAYSDQGRRGVTAA